MMRYILIYIVFCAIGVLSIILMVQMIIGLIIIFKLRSIGILKEATIVSINTSYYGIPYTSPIIEYQVNGKVLKKTMREQGLLKPWKIGDKVMIRHDPINAKKCYILVNSILYYIIGLLVSLLFAIAFNGFWISTLLGV